MYVSEYTFRVIEKFRHTQNAIIIQRWYKNNKYCEECVGFCQAEKNEYCLSCGVCKRQGCAEYPSNDRIFDEVCDDCRDEEYFRTL